MKMYVVMQPNGKLVGEECADGSGYVATPFFKIALARKAAQACNGVLGFWDWFNGQFVPKA